MAKQLLFNEEARKKLTKMIGVNIDSFSLNEEKVNSFTSLIKSFEGNIPILLRIKDNNVIKEFSADSKVRLDEELIHGIKKIFGDESLQLFTK